MRQAWREEIASRAPQSLVFLDETSTQIVMTRSRGRARRGERVVGRIPRNHGQNVTCLVAVGADGMRAPCVFPGSLDGPLFVQWVKAWLAPTLQPGTTVVLDNLSVHKNDAARAAIEAVGCQLHFLPPYSPDFNPIEMLFAKLKAHLRAANARELTTLHKAIAEGLNQITAADIRGVYRHCGYPLPDPIHQPP